MRRLRWRSMAARESNMARTAAVEQQQQYTRPHALKLLCRGAGEEEQNASHGYRGVRQEGESNMRNKGA